MSLLQLYAPKPVNIVRGEMQYLFDSNPVRSSSSHGTKYLDMGASYGACNCGHCNPVITSAIKQQLDTLEFIQNTFPSDIRAKCAEQLAALAGMDKVFFTNSGTESVEGAIKFARAVTSRKEIVAAMRCFHGRTYGALSATWREEYRKPFEPLVPGFSHVPYNNAEKLRAAITDNTAAVLLEVVQGEGGIVPAQKDYLQQAREICNQHNTLLILDEVQTGFGRTGTMFAHEQYGIKPDIMPLAKSIANGFPMGAVVMTDEVASKVPQHSHGNTFGGNPVGCAASIATMDYLVDNNLAGKSHELGNYFFNQLKSIESTKIREVRGLGLMIGIELKEHNAPYLNTLMAKGIIALPSGKTVIRLLPPLVVTRDDVDRTTDALREVLA